MTTIFVPENHTIENIIENVLKKHGLKCSGSDSYSTQKTLNETETSNILDELKTKFSECFQFNSN